MKKDYKERPTCPECNGFMQSKGFTVTSRARDGKPPRKVHLYRCRECGRFHQQEETK